MNSWESKQGHSSHPLLSIRYAEIMLSVLVPGLAVVVAGATMVNDHCIYIEATLLVKQSHSLPENTLLIYVCL